MSKCLRCNISCWQYWISWTAFVKIYYYTQHTSCQFKYLCDTMIGLTCSWAWNIGPTLSPPPPLCVLTSLIAEGRRGAEPVSPFLSLNSFLPSSLCLFLSFYLSLCLLSLTSNLSEAPVVAGCECSACHWMIHSAFYSTMKASLSVHPLL